MIDVSSICLKCSETPNCISSLDKRKKFYLNSIGYFESREKSKKILINIFAADKKAEIINNKLNYLHVIFTSNFLGFKDDVEFVFDDIKKIINFRSRSQRGYYDFGANKKRMINISKLFEQARKPGLSK